MKKHHTFPSGHFCPECGHALKYNLVIKKGADAICFKCYQAASLETENPIRTARDIRVNPALRSVKRIGVPLRRSA